jgi:hypothetical protein
LTIAYAQSAAPVVVSLSGTGTEASIEISPATINFGSQVVSTTSWGQTITIQNTGDASLTIANVSTTGDFATLGACTSVPAGSNCSLTVTFTPTATGARTGTVTVTGAVAGGSLSQIINLAGIGTQTGASLAPSAQTFPGTLVGATSRPLTATLTNTGNAQLTGIALAIAGDFAQTNNCPASLAAGTSCTLNIIYAPTVAGAETGTVFVTDNLGTQSVALTGNGLVPGATLSQAQLDFGSQQINTVSLAQTVGFTNTGAGPITISAVTASSNFRDTTNCTGIVAAGGSCSINVVFAPQTSGSLSEAIAIIDSAGTQSLIVQGEGAGSSGSIAPSFVIFGAQEVGATSQAQTLTATNTGSTAITLNPITVTGNFIESDQCPTTLPGGGSCLISVSFSPTATGSLYGTLNFSDASGAVSTVAALSGEGTLPGIATSPSTIFFGSLPVETASHAQTITVWNTGTAPLTISSVLGTGDFAEVDTCTQSAVPAGDYCVVNVTMTPTTVGTRTGLIQINDNADGVHQIALSGIGQQAGARVDPTSLAFGSLPIVSDTQAAGTPLVVTLTNSGDASLELSGIATTGDFTQSNTCGSLVAAGASCTITVEFSPTALGHRTGALTIGDNAGGRSQQVSLAGDGSPDGLQLTPPVMNFGVQTKGVASAAQTATLTNNTGAALTSLAITPTGEFSETDNCGASVANGSSCTLNITVTPATNGDVTGSVYIASGASTSVSGEFAPVRGKLLRDARPNASISAADSTSTLGLISVQASAAPATISVSASSLSYSSTAVGSSNTAQTVTLTNTGTSTPLTGLIIAGTNSAEFPLITTCGATLAAQSSCNVTVNFTPASVGPQSGFLNITADGGISVPVSESGIGSKGIPALALTCTSVTYDGSAHACSGAATGLGGEVVAGMWTFNPSSETAAGIYPVTGTFTSSDPNFASGETANGKLVICQATPALTLASSQNPALTQNGVTLTAVFSRPAGTTPTGSVTFYSGATLLGPAVTLNGGPATLVTSALPTGTNSLSAIYSGDSNFAGATSDTVAEVIEDFNLTIPSGGASQTVNTGQQATFRLSASPVAPATTFPAAINVSVTGLPAGATYTMTPSSLADGAGTTAITLVVTTAQTTAAVEKYSGSNHRSPGRTAPISFAVAMLLCIGGLKRNRKYLRRTLCAAIVVLAGGIATLLSGCGGSSGANQTGSTPQSYTITVTATAGSLQHSTNVTLTIE